RRIPDNECPGGSSELCQIDAADKPNWDADQTRKTQQFGTSKNRIGKSTACFPNWSRQFCKEVPIQRSSALPHEVTQYEEKDRDGNQRANSRHRKHDEVRGSSPDSMRHHDCADAFLVMPNINNRAPALTMIVMQNNTKPSSINADRYISLVA